MALCIVDRLSRHPLLYYLKFYLQLQVLCHTLLIVVSLFSVQLVYPP